MAVLVSQMLAYTGERRIRLNPHNSKVKNDFCPNSNGVVYLCFRLR